MFPSCNYGPRIDPSFLMLPIKHVLTCCIIFSFQLMPMYVYLTLAGPVFLMYLLVYRMLLAAFVKHEIYGRIRLIVGHTTAK